MKPFLAAMIIIVTHPVPVWRWWNPFDIVEVVRIGHCCCVNAMEGPFRDVSVVLSCVQGLTLR